MTWRHPTEADWDRERDYRKHESRPTDRQPEIPGADVIATLCRGMSDADAAALIQKFADTTAAIAVTEAVGEAHRRIIGVLEGGFHPAKDEVPA